MMVMAGEKPIPLLNRKEHATNLALEYDLLNVGANLISPLENSDLFLALKLEFKILKQIIKLHIKMFLLVCIFPSNKYLLNLDSFILGGITLKEGERTILTNTTSSGKLNLDSNYQTFGITFWCS